MPHHGFADGPIVALEKVDAAVRRAHEIRSRAYSRFFKRALDLRHRALSITSK